MGSGGAADIGELGAVDIGERVSGRHWGAATLGSGGAANISEWGLDIGRHWDRGAAGIGTGKPPALVPGSARHWYRGKRPTLGPGSGRRWDRGAADVGTGERPTLRMFVGERSK